MAEKSRIEHRMAEKSRIEPGFHKQAVVTTAFKSLLSPLLISDSDRVSSYK
jgi:hypothetical protein